eukprot:TRINITY_DN24020_c0_g1_i1.p1 TRINITY_DN24020_c0_g1~~TRINITY_DN24020_c0_g1_i1.p1  ORF type:complete len:222 (+),score=38.71 TRINITY_DN24020_c0_g1_i1:120-785(+)
MAGSAVCSLSLATLSLKDGSVRSSGAVERRVVPHTAFLPAHSLRQLSTPSHHSCARPQSASFVAPRCALAIDEADLSEADNESLMSGYPAFAAFPIHGTGRRKTAVARVGLIEGTGRIIVNKLPLNDYFQNQALMIQAVKQPLSSLGLEAQYDLVIKAHGGGLSAQAQAMVLGIARALCLTNAENRPPLKAQGMLTRDSRVVERKKYGLKKARKAGQFSKR